MSVAKFTDREAAAALYVIQAAIEDESASDVRAALVRAANKLRKQLGGKANPWV